MSSPTKRSAALPQWLASCSLAALVLALGTPARAQPERGDDLRDVVTLKSGKELRGRLRTPFADDELLVRRGGRRIRVDLEDVATLDTVYLHTREFFRLRALAGDDPRRQWPIVEWAEGRGLTALAGLQATWIALTDPENEAAHEYLEHRRDDDGRWLWPDPDGRGRRKFVPLATLEDRHQGHGNALRLRGEHFEILSDGSLLSSVATLFDLEILYLHLFESFGEELGFVEALRPMELQVWADEGEFPQQGGVDRPYYVPSPFGDYGASRLAEDPLRPSDLWSIGTQMILYRCLAENAPAGDPLDRFAAWAEIGLGEAMQARLGGPPGFGVVAAPTLTQAAGDWTLNGRKYGLENLIHLNLRNHFYGALLTAGEPHFSACHLFVEFLLQSEPALRAGFWTFLRGALADGQGDSSSAVDRSLGLRIEELEKPFAAWVQSATGAVPRRR